MNRREWMKVVGASLLAPVGTQKVFAENQGEQKKKIDLSALSAYKHKDIFKSWKVECFPLVCKACGNPLSLVQNVNGSPVALGCLECSLTPAITGFDWDSIVDKWIEVRDDLSTDVIPCPKIRDGR